MENEFFYEEINRAGQDIPHMEALRNLQYRAHYHEEIELVYMVDGMMELTVEGQELELQKGDIALVRPFLIHSISTPGYSRLYLFKILSPHFDFSSIYRDDTVLRPGDAEYAEIRGWIHQLIAELTLPDSDTLKRLALRSATDRLLVLLARLPGVRPVEKDTMQAHNRDVDLLKVINTYLDEHYQDSVSLEEAAMACHMSMYYFAHSFKRATGTTFLNYLNSFRLEQARHRITETEESFTEIAMQCGFASIRTFNRCFLKHYKITPSEARVRWKQEGHSIKIT